MLTNLYEETNATEKQVEIVFVSLDSNKQQFDDYYGTMPFLSAQYDPKLAQEIIKKIPIVGIPHLAVLNKDGTVKTHEGRSDVMTHGNDCVNQWKN